MKLVAAGLLATVAALYFNAKVYSSAATTLLTWSQPAIATEVPGTCFYYRDCDERDPSAFESTQSACFQSGGMSFLSRAGVCTNR